VLFENDRVRTWDLTLEPGEATAWHQHHHDYLIVVIEGGPVSLEYGDGTIEHQNDEVGHVEMRQDADQAHRLVNNSSRRYRNIVIELK
jgi:quercetin dioxygenase-like cupin family protein